MTDCVCGHYKLNHRNINGFWVGKCAGQTGCAGHEPCRCKEFKARNKCRCSQCDNEKANPKRHNYCKECYNGECPNCGSDTRISITSRLKHEDKNDKT